MNAELRETIKTLLTETGKAHHEAFADTNGEDPDWPIWYADYARDKFAERLGMEFTRSALVYCLMNANFEHEARAPEENWVDFFADLFLDRCAPSASPAEDLLALYHFDGCPYCAKVKAVIDGLGIKVELRDIFSKDSYRDELVAARGRATVPVLRITSPTGEDRWMPESGDIVKYLQKTYA